MQGYFPIRRLWLFSIFVMNAVPAYSKPPVAQKVVYAKQLTVENGLSSNFVYAILRDSKNFTWVATTNGLNKYDGQTFRQYFQKPFDTSGLQSNMIKALAEDRAGSVWIGTLDAGLERLDRSTDHFTHFRHSVSDPGSIGSDNVTALFVDSRGRLWIGLANGELDYFDPNTQAFWRYRNVVVINPRQSANAIIAISEDSHGVLCLRELQGSVIFDPASARCFSMQVTDKKNRRAAQRANFLPRPKMDAGFFIDRGSMFYSPRALSSEFDISEGIRIGSKILLDFSGRRLIFRNDSTLWNLSMYGLQEIQMSSSSIISVEIRSLTNTLIKLRYPRDAITVSNGAVWVATENGVVIIEPDLHPILQYPLPNEDNLMYSSARSICLGKDGTLWVGTSIGNLYYRDTINDVLRTFPIANNSTAGAFNRMGMDDNGALWIAGTNNPLLRVDLRTHYVIDYKEARALPIASSAHSILIEGSSIWTGAREVGDFAGTGALNHFSFSPLIVHRYEYLPQDSALTLGRIVMTIVRRDSNSLWLGTAHGLFILDVRTGDFTRYGHDPHNPASLSGDNVWVVHRDRGGHVWIGTWGEGLNLFDEKKQTFSHYTIDDGLPSNSIRSILEDDRGDLWISTENGISHFDQEKKIFTNFGISDGLLDVVYEPNSAAVSDDGKLYFGGSRGVVSFYPWQLERKKIDAPLVVTAFRLLHHLRYGEIGSGTPIVLDHTDNSFSYEFAKLDYLDPSLKQYEYMLSGVDKEWVNSGSRNVARYDNIDPGNYTFMFRMKEDTSRIFSSSLTILPPLWLTWWSKLSITLSFVLLVGFVFSRRRSKAKEFQRQLELATENERVELAGELHDGPLQDLYASRFMLDPLMRSGGAEVVELDTLLKKVRGDLRTLTGQMQIPRFDSGFAEELRLFCEAFGERHPGLQIVQTLQKETNPLPTKMAQNLFRIFRTAMANVAKHANATTVVVSFVTTEENATLVIIDDGVGFTVPEDMGTFTHNRHYGMFLMQSYAASVSGKCMIVSSPGNGTEVRVIVPLQNSVWKKLRS